MLRYKVTNPWGNNEDEVFRFEYEDGTLYEGFSGGAGGRGPVVPTGSGENDAPLTGEELTGILAAWYPKAGDIEDYS